MSAAAAQNGTQIEFFLRPTHRHMSGKFGVAFMTGKPFSAAFESYRDDIAFVMIMSAPRFIVYVHTDDVHAVN